MPKRRKPSRSADALRALIRSYGKAPREHKYNAKRCVVDGRTFASQKEARRYGELRLLERAGKIEKLRCQVRFKLVQIVHYVADFVYLERGVEVVEDAKGFKTPEYKRKRRLMASQHQIEIREV